MVLDLEKVKARERRLLQRKAKLESDLARLQKRAREAERRADSRRKIVLGSVVLKAVREGTLSEFSVREIIDSYASERDKAALADLDFGMSGEAVSEPPAAAVRMDEFEPLDRRE